MKACSLVVMVAALAAVGCSTGPTAPSTTPLSVSAGPESIHISVQVVSNPGLARTWQYRATATARFSDGSTEDVTTKAGWTSSNPSVATISIPRGDPCGISRSHRYPRGVSKRHWVRDLVHRSRT
jgi:hypothetical protein